MPPKRPLKRRSEDEGRKQTKRTGKNKREQTYGTYDEALDGGVEMEEKGERYRDGEKAQRFYERAVELYAKASEFKETYDVTYNRFLLPPSSLPLLRESITLYQHATTLSNSPLLLMDVAFNLAQAFTTLADIMDDLRTTDDAEKDEAVLKLRNDAKVTLAEVMDGQEAYLRTVVAQGGEDTEEGEEVVEHIEGGAENQSMEVDVGDKEDDEGDDNTSTWETHLPTPSTYIDTVLTLVDLHLLLWESTPTPQPPTEEEQIAVRVILDRAASIAPSGRQAELDLAEVKVLLTMDRIIWDMYKREAKAGSGIENSLDGAITAIGAVLTSLDAVPAEDSTVRPEILTTMADTHVTIANRLMFLNTQPPPGPAPLAQSAWAHLTQATTHLTSAVGSPTDANTPREFKPSVFLSLSKVSLARAKLASLNDTAQKNIVQLFDNATTYASRAGETLGWTFLRVGPAPPSVGGTLNIGGVSIGGKDLPYPSGWDSELLGRNIALQQVRVCLYATRTELLPAESKGQYKGVLSKILEKLGKMEEGERKITGKDVERWLGEVEDEEVGLGEIEKGWWTEITAGL
ncbi:hypothetical protein I305_03909 [Cryptococcus gattii E566]|uniref:Uncharacterized protein n=2 Tax=Cryptococcus gattii TaxID=37769 RepID=E6R4R3_CRYGW|nr:uncharacterized protein CGB_D8020C [Cryptococcus gattii WM276]ADV22148.1 hypothetical protein CNJ01530 [Cryptococcus gattii WM276]KIR80472.1 hypothetical protein I306_02450 [Cryptococcus gattii EJB2]KIY33517.1 hypothetical protein I305_03909 [Cryptococcus gattii E566]KJE03410.1 hypothetical protein I311_02710 [Cryptococcus gattii NT-10]